MKKLLALTLALLTVLTLLTFAACGKQETTTDTPAAGETTQTNPQTAPEGVDLAATKPNEYIMEKLDAGMEVLIGFSANVENWICNDLQTAVKAAVEPLGCSFNYQNAGGDSAMQITHIENFVEMKAAAVVIVPQDAAGLEDVVTNAIAAGTHCIIFGSPTTYDAMVTRADTLQEGVLIGQMAIAWLDQTYPDAPAGSIKAAVLGSVEVYDNLLKTNGMKDTISADPRVELIYSQDECTTLDVAVNSVEEAYTMNPDLRLVLSWSVDGAVGANNYIMSLPDVKPEEWGVFGFGMDPTLPQMFEDADNGNGVFRGVILDGETPHDSTVELTLGALNGTYTTPYELMQPLYTFTSESLDYHYDSREED